MRSMLAHQRPHTTRRILIASSEAKVANPKTTEIVFDCPRCGTQQVTLDVEGSNLVGLEHGWRVVAEVYAICRACKKSCILVCESRETTFKDAQMPFGELASLRLIGGSLTRHMRVRNYISIKDREPRQAPDHLPQAIDAAFREGATCLGAGCVNAAGTMFRLCVDMAVSDILKGVSGEQPDPRTKRNLGLLIPWLFEKGYLPEELHDLSTCIKDDGNDGAHRGNLSEQDADDLFDFTVVLLEGLYTRKERIRLARIRRDERGKGG